MTTANLAKAPGKSAKTPESSAKATSESAEAARSLTKDAGKAAERAWKVAEAMENLAGRRRKRARPAGGGVCRAALAVSPINPITNMRQDDDHDCTMLGTVRDFLNTPTTNTAKGPAIPTVVTALSALHSRGFPRRRSHGAGAGRHGLKAGSQRDVPLLVPFLITINKASGDRRAAHRAGGAF